MNYLAILDVSVARKSFYFEGIVVFFKFVYSSIQTSINLAVQNSGNKKGQAK